MNDWFYIWKWFMYGRRDIYRGGTYVKVPDKWRFTLRCFVFISGLMRSTSLTMFLAKSHLAVALKVILFQPLAIPKAISYMRAYTKYILQLGVKILCLVPKVWVGYMGDWYDDIYNIQICAYIKKCIHSFFNIWILMYLLHVNV